MARRGKLQFLFLFLFIAPLSAQISSVTSDGYLRDWQYDGDHVIYSTENGNINSVITSDDERLVLRKYDEKHRLTSEVIWSGDFQTITSETEWTYPDKGVFPETMTKKLLEQKQTVKVLYTATGLETERTVSSMAEDGSEGEFIEKTVWQYDSENRVICKVHESDDVVQRTEYTYTEKADEPDMKYFEDDVLVEAIERLSGEVYTDRLYFENMEIQTTWENGVKTDEKYYLDGKEIKRNQ